MIRVSTNSPLAKPPLPISERQIVRLDGIRYSANMSAIAIYRLGPKLCQSDTDMNAATYTTSWDTTDHFALNRGLGLPADHPRQVIVLRTDNRAKSVASMIVFGAVIFSLLVTVFLMSR